MARKVFFSFHYNADNWRASKIRNIGAIEGNQLATDNEWERITTGGDAAIQSWIDNQMIGRSCAIVLIGSQTAKRKWIDYEIKKAWRDHKGVLGIYIHNITDRDNRQCTKGINPFQHFTLRDGTIRMSDVVKSYDPPDGDSPQVYKYIKNHLAAWIEDAISIRGRY